MKAIVLFNPAAGSMPADGASRMRAALRAMAVDQAEIVETDFTDGDSQMLSLLARSPDLLIVWGGDGTHRAALRKAGRDASNLLLLPGGTMNLLSKSLHGVRPWEEILQDVLANPVKRRLPAGLINGEPFYCAMLAGAPVAFAEARESLRFGDLGKAFTQFGAALDALEHLHLVARYRDGYRFPDERLPTTSVLGVLVGPTSNNGRMEVATLSKPSALAALAVVWSSLLSDWRHSPDANVVSAETLVIDSEGGGDIPAMIDGEAMQVGSHAQVVYVEHAAQCLTAG